jgi:hypothetical protein
MYCCRLWEKKKVLLSEASFDTLIDALTWIWKQAGLHFPTYHTYCADVVPTSLDDLERNICLHFMWYVGKNLRSHDEWYYQLLI